MALLVSCGCAANEVEDILIHTPEGATLSALVALPDTETPVPAILTFDIYTNPDAQKSDVAKLAERGYAGVIAYARGKYRSQDPVDPYEHEARDASAVVDWIARQPWSNGKVGMIGGSYNGFTAWAAAKYHPRALEAIAVSAAAIPGQGLPMYNNIFQNSNYAWTFYVTNNKLLDEKMYGDNDRWRPHPRNWFLSGRPYREFDAVDGTPNPWFQRWLRHPAFDAYWQSMVPYGKEFARIDIPVLTITGYYDAAQISALQYFHEHTRWNRKAEHYVAIGPYDHFGSSGSVKPAVLRGYTIDNAAQLDSQALKLAFMDYALRGEPKPALLADRINFEVMGTNEWRHAPSVAGMHRTTRRLYFSAGAGDGAMNALTARSPAAGSSVLLEVDLADRVEFHGFHAFPNPIVQGPLEYITESLFESEPFTDVTTISGPFAGELNVTINKKDFDPTIAVYEKQADGKLFHLGFAMLRASFAKDPTRRVLLKPGVATRIRFETTWISKRLEPGSRLLVLLDTNKNMMAQVNYGTGRDVSDESVQDAGEPLQIRWNAGSYLDVPID